MTGIKFLVPEYAAGAIIGKGGKNISVYKDKFDTQVRMSPGREFFPQTEERVCLITRDVIDPDQLTACFQYLCVLVREEPENNGRVRRMRDPDRRNQASFILEKRTNTSALRLPALRELRTLRVAGSIQVYSVAGGIQVYFVTNYSTCCFL